MLFLIMLVCMILKKEVLIKFELFYLLVYFFLKFNYVKYLILLSFIFLFRVGSFILFSSIFVGDFTS